MKLDIITPERTFFSGEAQSVTAPGAEGDFGVLPGHAPFVSTLRPGKITVERVGEAALKLVVTEGIAEVTPEKCVILAEALTAVDDITAADAQVELRAAEEAVHSAIADQDRANAEKRLAMAKAVAEAI